MGIFSLCFPWRQRRRDPVTAPMAAIPHSTFSAIKRESLEQRTGLDDLTEDEVESALAAEMHNSTMFGRELFNLRVVRDYYRDEMRCQS